jgi:hypothetical protein
MVIKSKPIRILLKIMAITSVSIMGLFLIIGILLHIPAIQKSIINKAESFYFNKTNVKLEIEGIHLNIRGGLAISGIYVPDQKNDTLLYATSISTGLNYIKLLSNQIDLGTIKLEGITCNLLKNNEDSLFNFQFIADAFASTDTSVKDTTSEGMTLVADQLDVQNLSFTFYDQVSGMNLKSTIADLSIEINRMNLDSFQFHLGKIDLQGASVQFATLKEQYTDSTTNSTSPDITFETINIKNCEYYQMSIPDSSGMIVKCRDSYLESQSMSLPNNIIHIKEIMLDGATFQTYNKKTVAQTNTKETDAIQITIPYDISLSHLQINDSYISQQNATDSIPELYAINEFEAKDITAFNETASINIIKAKASDSNGLHITSLNGKVIILSHQLMVEQFSLVTPNSNIALALEARFQNLAALINNPGETIVEILCSTELNSVKDIELIAPAITAISIIKANYNRHIQFQTALSGKINELHIEQFELKAGNSTNITAAGFIKNLSEQEPVKFEKAQISVQSIGSELKSILSLPSNINLPESIILKGSMAGLLENLQFRFDLATNRGSIQSHGILKMQDGKEPEYYAKVRASKVDVGFYIGKSGIISNTSFLMSVHGTSFDPEKMDTRLQMLDAGLNYNSYQYQNINLTASLVKNLIQTNLIVNDTNLHASIIAEISLDSVNQSAKASIRLEGSDLKNLHLASKPLRVSGESNIKIKGFDINNMNGLATFSNILIIKEEERYPLDSVYIKVLNTEQRSEIILKSQIVDANLKGTLNMTTIPQVIKNYTSNYIQSTSGYSKINMEDQNFEFAIDFHDPALFAKLFVPNLKEFEAGTIAGNFNGPKSELNIQVDLPLINYNDIRFKDLQLIIQSNSELVDGKLKIAAVTSGNIKLPLLTASMTLKNSEMLLNLNISDSVKTRLDLTTNATIQPDGYEITFPDDRITLDDRVWALTPSATLNIKNKNFSMTRFELQSGDERISATRNSGSNAQETSIEISSFKLATITQIISADTMQAEGTINGTVELEQLSGKTAMEIAFEISDFEYRNSPVGDMTVKIDSRDQIKYVANLAISNSNNSINANATYFNYAENGSIESEVKINKMQMTTLQAFIPNAINDVSGNIHGEFAINGAIKDPDISGEIAFDGVKGRVLYLNNTFSIQDEKIIIRNKSVTFNNFIINDSLNNRTTIDGDVDYSLSEPIGLNLEIRSDNFLLLNTQKGDNDLYFGTLYIDNNLTVTGTTELPKVEASVKILDKSRLTFVVPEKMIEEAQGEGEIRFVDKHSATHAIMKSTKAAADSITKSITGIDLIANIEINNNSTLTILVDKQTSDSLIVQGDAVISLMIDPGGKTSMTGTFEISEGSYLVSLENLVKKRFVLTKGSTIAWKGDVTDADLEIEGIATVNAPPLELVADQVSGLSETDLNRYRQRLPFQVILHMEGVLLKPQISFEIGLLPEDQGALNGTVYAKLNSLNQDESELNKQVFALLVLNRFIQSNPLEGGSGIQNVARNSVSKFLSQQLNSFAMQYIKGVELNFDVQSYEDYSTNLPEGKTEVNVGVTKRLMGDRLIVQVAGNIAVEGESAKQNNMSDIAGDIVLEYLLTEDGRYRLKVFRKDQYEGILDGEIKESGIGLVYTRDFDKWGQFFRKPENNTNLQ